MPWGGQNSWHHGHDSREPPRQRARPQGGQTHVFYGLFTKKFTLAAKQNHAVA
jgi:hypothetical protein